MNTNKLLYSECIQIYNVESTFIDSLSELGLIHVVSQDEERYIDSKNFQNWNNSCVGTTIWTST